MTTIYFAFITEPYTSNQHHMKLNNTNYTLYQFPTGRPTHAAIAIRKDISSTLGISNFSNSNLCIVQTKDHVTNRSIYLISVYIEPRKDTYNTLDSLQLFLHHLVNDPLWKDSYVIDGETSFNCEHSAREFQPDAAGYINLVEKEHRALADTDKNYAKTVPASAHVYYHSILYWYKLALAAVKRGITSHDQKKLIRFVEGYPSAVVAAGAGEYLEGLGDYTDITGVKHILRAAEPNEQS